MSDSRRFLLIIVSLLIITAFIPPACLPTTPPATEPAPVPTTPPAPPPTSTPEPPSVLSATGRPTGPFSIKLSLSEPPALGKPVQVTVSFVLQEWYPIDFKGGRAEIELQEGWEVVERVGFTVDKVAQEPTTGFHILYVLRWQGDIIRGRSYEMKATVKAAKTGDYMISAGAHDWGYTSGDSAYLYMRVFKDSAIVSDSTDPKLLPNFKSIHKGERPKVTELPLPYDPKKPPVKPDPPPDRTSLPRTGTLSNPLTVKGMNYHL